MAKIKINSNGVKCVIDGIYCHAEYYVGDDVVFKKTFKNLTDNQIARLSVEDMWYANIFAFLLSGATQNTKLSLLGLPPVDQAFFMPYTFLVST